MRSSAAALAAAASAAAVWLASAASAAAESARVLSFDNLPTTLEDRCGNVGNMARLLLLTSRHVCFPFYTSLTALEERFGKFERYGKIWSRSEDVFVANLRAERFTI